MIAGLSVKLPDRQPGCSSSATRPARDEAVRVVDSVIKSYDLFLQENYQKNSNEVLGLITKARDELSARTSRGWRRSTWSTASRTPPTPPAGMASPSSPGGSTSGPNVSQAMLRSLRAQEPARPGTKPRRRGERDIDYKRPRPSERDAGHPCRCRPGPCDGPLRYERLAAQLGEIEFQRQTAESVLEHLRAEHAKAVSSAQLSDAELVPEFYAEPEVADRAADLKDAKDRFNEARRVSRRTDEASLVALGKRIKELEAELGRMWQRRKPRLQARLAGAGDDQAIRQAANEVMALRAKEAALGERLDQFKAQRLLELEAKHDRLAKQHGPQHAKVQEVREQIRSAQGRRERGVCRSQGRADRPPPC